MTRSPSIIRDGPMPMRMWTDAAVRKALWRVYFAGIVLGCIIGVTAFIVLLAVTACSPRPQPATYAIGNGVFDSVGVMLPNSGRVLLSDHPRPLRAGGDAFGIRQAPKAVRK